VYAEIGGLLEAICGACILAMYVYEKRFELMAYIQTKCNTKKRDRQAPTTGKPGTSTLLNGRANNNKLVI
jgi:hypothetical protein